MNISCFVSLHGIQGFLCSIPNSLESFECVCNCGLFSLVSRCFSSLPFHGLALQLICSLKGSIVFWLCIVMCDLMLHSMFLLSIFLCACFAHEIVLSITPQLLLIGSPIDSPPTHNMVGDKRKFVPPWFCLLVFGPTLCQPLTTQELANAIACKPL